ncbi:MAG: thioredoxin [Gammaproteobacteria bacterium HGW-Gammaproteobacteria-14]|nr:MAG: thioredoxin [Gammaproteobacteria bacterium HGW-Gammaproteobacteria-14]
MKACQIGFNPDYSDDAPALEQVSQLAGDALLEFGASWCGYCLGAQPAVRQALLDYPALPHIKVADGKGRPLGRAFGVKLWPTLILLRNGREVARLVRPSHPDQVRQLLAP